MSNRRIKGRWKPGQSGNPAGRPVGARDKWPRRKGYHWRKPLTYEQEAALTARLGKYAQRGHGGPGRPRGSYGYGRLLTEGLRGDTESMRRFVSR
jgi:hypothetical protein